MEEKPAADTNLPSTGDEAEENLNESQSDLKTTRQCLIIYFLLVQCGIIDASTGEPKYGIQKKAVNDLISYLTSKKADNIKKRYNNMFKGTPQNFEENLQAIRPYFERLQLSDIIAQINKNLGVRHG
jgi:hypothetical protein